MKIILVIFLLFQVVNSTASAEQTCLGPEDRRVPVFVVTTIAGGFTNPNKGVADSTKNLIHSLKKKKAICLTEKREDAAIVLEVMDREKAQVTATWAGAGRDCTVTVKFTFGDYETILSDSAAGGTISSGGAWSKAAGKVAKQVEQWVVKNADAIKAKREIH